MGYNIKMDLKEIGWKDNK
jgi:hypothetical protein